ncbi:MAG: 1-acyl-sn-glycerol-3-phosphate acyltransferase [Flavobacteriia bacterium]|nr:1-acyl-sn-glycerol-3-phosphate acyltransferase [Flavobacteriia bacterium]OJX39233.1 MAG: 1-acyl-sn-glycerol-3-phosphate acyltransferase [Flavobacteriia bacterium 40-80]
MRIVLGFILTPVFYLLFCFFLGIFHPIQWLSLKLGGYNAHKKSVDILNFFLNYSQLIMLNWVCLKQRFKLPKNRSILFVSNHQSSFDIPGLIYYFRKFHGKFVSKIELSKAKIPSISFNLLHGGAANIDRNNPELSKREIAKLADNMRNKKWSAFIFPEGTRSKDGIMKPFKIGGIETFANLVPDLLIVPVAISGSYNIVRRGPFPLMPFNKIKWEVLEPIELRGKNIADIVKAAENAIRNKISK